MLDEFKKAEGVDLSTDKMALQRLKEAAEKAKKELSQMCIRDRGRIAKAIRTVVKAAASKEDRKVIVEIMQQQSGVCLLYTSKKEQWKEKKEQEIPPYVILE